MTIKSDDPRLTAYVLGELDSAERAAFEKLLAEDPAARVLVDELRRTAGKLQQALAGDAGESLTADQRATIRVTAETAPLAPTRPTASRRIYRLLIPSALAACVLAAAWIGYATWPGPSQTRDFVSVAGAPDRNVAPGRAVTLAGGGNCSHNPTITCDPADLFCGECVGDPSADINCNQPLLSGGEPCGAGGACKVLGSSCDNVSSRVARMTNGGSPKTGAALYTLDDGNSSSPSSDTVAMATVDATQEYSIALRMAPWSQLQMASSAPPNTLVYGELDENRSRARRSAATPSRAFDLYGNVSYGYQVPPGVPTEPFNRESYLSLPENPFLVAVDRPLSTFSIDVDTASYANVRRFLNLGALPPPAAVRIEELINYFDYDYPLPTGDDPFSVNVEIAECPWDAGHRLARIGLKGMEFPPDERPSANLVFLIDVSGSMQPPDKLPLLIQGMKLLVDQLYEDDKVAIAVYAGASGLVLPSTYCSNRTAILNALNGLQAGGSTNGGEGIHLAYDIALDEFIEGGINRVILATDGDFNVGVTSRNDLEALITDRAADGVFLTVLGFGTGNLQDATLEMLADKGNGHYAYIDSLAEARKALVEQVGGTLATIAKDVKIQVEFNPAVVGAYRLVGYENRMLRARDFNDDTKDAGEIGAGHTVTALYELVPAGMEAEVAEIYGVGEVSEELPADQLSESEEFTLVPPEPAEDAGAYGEFAEVDPLRYRSDDPGIYDGGAVPAVAGNETMTVKLRYKQPDGDFSRLIEVPVTDYGMLLEAASDDFVFAASVASFGMLLRHSDYADLIDFNYVAELAESAVGDDPNGYRTEFVELVRRAGSLNR